MASASARPAPAVAAYSFRQLETPAGGAVHNLADVLSAAWEDAERIRTVQDAMDYLHEHGGA